MFQLARSNDGAAAKGILFVFHNRNVLSFFKVKFSPKGPPQFKIFWNLKPIVNVSAQSCAEVRQCGKVKAAYRCFLKRIQITAKVVVQRSACGPSNHGDVHSHQIPCESRFSVDVDGLLQLFIGLNTEAIHVYDLIAVSIQVVKVLICGQESIGNKLIQDCF